MSEGVASEGDAFLDAQIDALLDVTIDEGLVGRCCKGGGGS